MDSNLFLQAIKKFIIGLILIAALLFIPAGTLNYPNGWLFICILFIPMIIVGIILMIKDPDLLKKRLNAKENESTQKAVLLVSGVMFISSFAIAGLNFRFNWSTLPDIIVIAASIVFLVGYVMYMEVLRENKYLARTVEVEKNQQVIDCGLYGMVRHPMYTSTILLFLTMPLILNSIFSFIICLIYPIIIIIRIKNEEQVLERELNGYSDYKEKVKYRLFPFIL